MTVKDITNLDREERRKILGTEIGYVPQNTRGSFNNIRSYDVQYKRNNELPWFKV